MDRVDEITRDCLNAIIQVRRLDAQSVPDPQFLHRRLCTFIDAMIGKARELGLGPDETGDIVYPIVALADEVAQAMPGPVQQHWMYNLLQLRYFNETLAGENFFVRVDNIRGDPRRVDVLKVYYLCLLFGFQGRFRVRGGDAERAAFVERLQQDLARFRLLQEEPLSPRGGRPAAAGSAARRSLPIIWLSAAAIITALLLNVVLHASLASGVGDVVDRIGALTARATAR